MNKLIARIAPGVISALLLLPFLVFATGSTINTTVPAANSALQSAPIRANFTAAYNDINGLIQQNAATTAPSGPILGQLWLNTSATPYVLKEWDGAQWVQIGVLNATTHTWILPPLNGGTGLSSPGTIGNVLTSTGSGWASQTPTNTGTVTSVNCLFPSILNVSGCPITTSGTIAATLATQNANLVFAGPSSGAAASPTFRSLVPGDIPQLNQNTTGTAGNVTSTVAAGNGGTGLTTCSNTGYVLTWNGSGWSCSAATAGGTVTSVGLALPISLFNITGSPVTGTGTLTGSLANQPANYVWAGPVTGGATTPAFRALIGPDLPVPSASTLGGVESLAAVSHNFLTSISTAGVPTQAQPAFTDVSGSAACSQLPALTGDVTTTAGTCAATLATVNLNTGAFGSSTAIPVITTNGKGLITAASTAAVVAPVSTLSGAGTGVTSALANATNGTGGLVTFSGALGTPTSGVATNLTGTASGLTAGAVTTNANLTGDVTSTGNATTLATVNSNVGSFTNANITVNGKGLITAASSGSGGAGGLTLISTQTASNSASLSWTGLGTTYNSYLLIFRDVVPASSQDLLFVQIGEGGTPTWKTTTYTGSGTYEPTNAGTTVTPSSWSQGGSGTASAGVNITESSSAGSSAWQVQGDGQVYIHNIPSTTKFVTFVGDVGFISATTLGSSNYLHGTIYGFYQGDNTTAKTAIRLIAASGNIASGTASLYGISN